MKLTLDPLELAGGNGTVNLSCHRYPWKVSRPGTIPLPKVLLETHVAQSLFRTLQFPFQGPSDRRPNSAGGKDFRRE